MINLSALKRRKVFAVVLPLWKNEDWFKALRYFDTPLLSSKIRKIADSGPNATLMPDFAKLAHKYTPKIDLDLEAVHEEHDFIV